MDRFSKVLQCVVFLSKLPAVCITIAISCAAKKTGRFRSEQAAHGAEQIRKEDDSLTEGNTVRDRGSEGSVHFALPSLLLHLLIP